jgi:hypothetical protein
VKKDLVLGLGHLRSEAREISSLYLANLQRDIVQLIDFVNGADMTGGKPVHLGARLRRIKETFDHINVKPEKGRRKDLRRIERAVRAMMRIAFAKSAHG